jgi:ubiquinone/menaquinone biosynthesis C-methylase UbiE
MSYSEVDSAPQGLATMSAALHEAENYHRWQFEWVAPFLSGKILDIGSGTGNHLKYLKDFELVSVDIDPECINDLKIRYRDQKQWKFLVADVTQANALSGFADESFDTVFSSNVLEHLENDAQVIKNLSRLLKKGGKLVVLLPAHEGLFGRLDTFAGHYRRYSKKSLAKRMIEAELAPLSLNYVNAVGAIGWFVNGRILRPKGLSTKSINSQILFFDRWVIPVLRTFERTVSLPFGQSLLGVATKQ